MKVIGILFLLLGFVLTLTIFLAFIGIPLMFIGAILIWAGRSPTIITNTVYTNPTDRPDDRK